MGANGAKELVPSLMKMSQLTILDLGNNAIGDAGIQALSQALMHTPLLKYFKFTEINLAILAWHI